MRENQDNFIRKFHFIQLLIPVHPISSICYLHCIQRKHRNINLLNYGKPKVTHKICVWSSSFSFHFSFYDSSLQTISSRQFPETLVFLAVIAFIPFRITNPNSTFSRIRLFFVLSVQDARISDRYKQIHVILKLQSNI